MYPNNLSPHLKGRPVSSIDEVRAMGIDFDGSIFYFPDVANKKIYTKQINMDGTVSIHTYEQVEEVPISYVTKEEFTRALEELKAVLPKNTNTNFNF